MSKELAKAYEPKEVEDRIYDFWMKGKYFHAEVDPKKKPSLRMASTIFASVAMEAWSVPGSHRAE